jgi:hypothetical protein
MAKLATKTRNAEPKSVFAFAKRRKTPLENPRHSPSHSKSSTPARSADRLARRRALSA